MQFDVRLDRIPKAVIITHRNIYSTPRRCSSGPTRTSTKTSWSAGCPASTTWAWSAFTSRCTSAQELVKVTLLDFLRDTLLWAKLIDKYKGTMTAAPNFAYALFAKRLRRQAKPAGEFDLSTLRFALSGAEPVEPADVEDLIDAGKAVRPAARRDPLAYGMAETTLAVSFSVWRAGLVVDEVDADLLAALRRAVPASKGNVRRLATLGPLLQDLEARIVDGDGNVLPARGGRHRTPQSPLTPGYLTMGGFVVARDENGWYDTGDLGYLTEEYTSWSAAGSKDVIIMAGRNIYPTDIERAAGRVEGVRPVRRGRPALDAGHSRETFAAAVGINAWEDAAGVPPPRASGGPRGGRRGRRAAAQRRGTRPRHDPEDSVGQAAPLDVSDAGQLKVPRPRMVCA